MKKKFILILLLVIVSVIGLSAAYAVSENDTTNNTTLSVNSEPPISVSELVNSIKVQPSFKTYDPTALSWLEQFDSNYVVFTTNEYYIIMNSTDASKLNQNEKIGVSIDNNITCNIVENMTLGSGLNNILHVENVEVISNDVNNFVFN